MLRRSLAKLLTTDSKASDAMFRYKSVRPLKTLTVFFLLILFSANTVGQLPELEMPASVSGIPTTAKFFGGATADQGSSYANSFAFDLPISIFAEIQVEEAHLNTMGNLYIIILLGEDYFVRDENGVYHIWDLTLGNLLAASPAKTLQANEPLTIIENVAFGPAGVSGVALNIFLAYDSVATLGEIYYSGTPLIVAIEQEVVESASLTLFTTNISQPIIQSRCVVCHVSGGSASNSSLIYATTQAPEFQTTNYNTLVNYIKNVQNGAGLLLAKPQGQTSHGGGVQLANPSTELTHLQEFINAVAAE